MHAKRLTELAELAASSREDTASAQNVLIRQFCPGMGSTTHYGGVQSAMPLLVLDVLPVRGPPDIARSVVCRNAIPVGDLMKRRRLQPAETLRHQNVDPDLPSSTAARKLHVVIALAREPRPEDVPRLFAPDATVRRNLVVRFEADNVAPFFRAHGGVIGTMFALLIRADE